jgi:UDP-N-acetyl-D-mannosaminuronic acid transferase (WecB/TagA/CpsF family)
MNTGGDRSDAAAAAPAAPTGVFDTAPLSTNDADFRRILGIRFFVGSASKAAQIGLSGGLVVVPAAPALVDLTHDQAYREALTNADLAITDSGLMVLIWRFMQRERITRVSGLEYLRIILKEPALRTRGAVLWVLPTLAARSRTVAWLAEQGFPTTDEDCYVAPVYPPANVVDPTLLDRVKSRRPAHIVIGLGGGVQEKLGYFLRQNAGYRPATHCIGAAIGFLTGDQVPIPWWADYLVLGWLFRCLSEPRKFIPRYWKARRLLPLMFKYRDRLPDLAQPPH